MNVHPFPSPALPDPVLLPTKQWERWKYSPLAAIVTKGEWTPHALPANQGDLPDWANRMRERPPLAATYGDAGIIEWGARHAHRIKVLDVPAHTERVFSLEDIVPQSGLNSVLVLIRVGDGGRLRVHDTVSASAPSKGWLHRVIRIDLGPGASCDWVRTHQGSDHAVITDFMDGLLAAGARCDLLTLGLGARFCRHQIHINLTGSGADLTLRGGGLIAGDRHADTTITIEHQAPGCRSNQAYRHLVADNATGVFQGKVHVHQPAQQTDGYQLCNSILLSPLAQMNTKPELEIYADDVKCSHGTTTGRLDETPLFYMRSRGIPEKEARRILLESFLAEILDDPAGLHMDQAGQWLDRHVL